MVFFTCDACGESLKKASVEKHYQFQCRNCSVLSCVDCGKDFYGDAYKEHTKCISEAEKYSGKDYKPKENANKGEAKQNQWIEQVQSAISKNKANPRLRGILERLEDYPNIPRKRAKFENFVKNSLGVRDAGLAARTWEVIAAEMNQPQAQNGQSEDQQKAAPDNKSQQEKQNGDISTEESQSKDDTEKKLSKRERKEERRKAQNKEEKKEKKRKKSEEEAENGDEAPSKKKKNKKRKHEEVESCEEEESAEPKKSKKKKKKNNDTEEQLQDSEDVDQEPENSAPVAKFSWEGAIIGVLKREDDKEIGMKKLRKKVLAQYHALGGDSKIKTEEELLGKFNKKVNKNPRLRVLKDRVKLVQ